MGRKSQTNSDQLRDKRYSAFIYVGDYKFRKSICTRRGNATGKCYEWKQEYLDLKDKDDESFVKSSMILIGEGEL